MPLSPSSREKPSDPVNAAGSSAYALRQPFPAQRQLRPLPTGRPRCAFRLAPRPERCVRSFATDHLQETRACAVVFTPFAHYRRNRGGISSRATADRKSIVRVFLSATFDEQQIAHQVDRSSIFSRRPTARSFSEGSSSTNGSKGRCRRGVTRRTVGSFPRSELRLCASKVSVTSSPRPAGKAAKATDSPPAHYAPRDVLGQLPLVRRKVFVGPARKSFRQSGAEL
jgi:hypothetical protein